MFPVLISDIWSLFIVYHDIILLLSPPWIYKHTKPCVLYHSYMYDLWRKIKPEWKSVWYSVRNWLTVEISIRIRQIAEIRKAENSHNWRTIDLSPLSLVLILASRRLRSVVCVAGLQEHKRRLYSRWSNTPTLLFLLQHYSVPAHINSVISPKHFLYHQSNKTHPPRAFFFSFPNTSVLR